ncbi:MAG: hypothetical protein P8I97_04000 [Verrucomicrobiales bacterium]|nr:hypothetical protein [Verrucomicrobiales bacterium]
MPEEEESNRPKLIIPESEENKSQNRLLVPPSDQEKESDVAKPQLITPIDQAEEPQAEEPQAEEPQAEEPQAEEPASSVKVVEMSPPIKEEEVIGQLPQPQEDDWMKDAYEQVADADRAVEVMSEPGNEVSSPEQNVEQTVEPVYQAPVEPVYQAPVESPLIASQLAPTSQMYAQQQVNPYQNVQPYQQTYSAPPSAGTYPYQQGMPTNVPPNQQVPVGQPRGIPGPAWLAIGLIVGAAVGLLIFKYMPQDMAAGFRPDLVDKGKALVINANTNMPAQNQTVAPVAPPISVPQEEEAPNEPEAVPDSDLESE